MAVRLVRFPKGEVYNQSDFTMDHDKLNNRGKPNQHPISAITNLQETIDYIKQEILKMPNQYIDTDTIAFIHNLALRTLEANLKISSLTDSEGRPNAIIKKSDGVYVPDFKDDIMAIPDQYIDSSTVDFTHNGPGRTLTADVKVVNSKENAIEIRKSGLFVDKYFDLDIEDTESIHLYFEGKGETLEEMYNYGNVFSHCRDSWSNLYSTAEANAWYFDTTLQSFVQPQNTAYLTGFVSTIKYRTYTHRAILRSSDGDDDVNGLVIAYVVDPDSKPHTLSCVVERGPDFTWHYALIYDFGLPDETVLFTQGNTGLGSATLANTSGWSGSYITMEVEKQGTIVSCAVSNWNSTVINTATTISIDLNDYLWGSLFVGKVQYGYCNWSQANSYFTDIVFQGKGPLRARVILSQDENNNIEIREDGLWCQGGNGDATSAASSILEIEQENHQLEIGDPVYCDTDGLYKKSYAEDTIRIETIGLVTEVKDENNFVITISGQFMTDMFNSYSDGTVLYLSDSQVGKLTDNPIRIYKPIAIKIQDSIIINIQRANYYRDISESEEDNPQDVDIEYYTYQEMQEIIDEIWEDDWESSEDYDMLDYKTLPVGALTPFMGSLPSDEWLLCDGSEYNIEDYNRLADYFTESYGSPNYFGGDGITTFAVPDTRERYFKGSDTAGTYTDAGLPNISGYVCNSLWAYKGSGAFYSVSHTNASHNNASGVSGTHEYDTYMDASKQNPIYGRSNTVTPKNISVLYCIKAK